MDKGFYDTKDDIRYILSEIKITIFNNVPTINAFFDRMINGVKDGVHQVGIPLEEYSTNNDIKVYYEILAKNIKADVVLPESMNWEWGL